MAAALVERTIAGGCPVVAVRASGVHDAVRDGCNGILAAESSGNWAKLLTYCRRLSTLSENSLAFAKDFSEEKIAEKILRLYRRVAAIAKSKAGSP